MTKPRKTTLVRNAKWHRSLDRGSAFVLLLLLSCFVCACGDRESEPEAPPKRRVLMIGIDGASDRVIGPLMRKGRLPNLAKIAEAGVYGPLQSSVPLLSPRIWTTVATGKDAEKHDIHSWVRKSSEAGVQRLNYSYDRKGHAIWNILSDADKRVGVVNWLTTYPPEVVQGVMVTSHTFPGEVVGKVGLAERLARKERSKLEPIRLGADRGPVVYPLDWTSRAIDPRHEQAEISAVPNPFLENARLPFPQMHATMAAWFERDEQLVSVTREIQREEDPDLLMVLLQGIDRVSHVLWAGVEKPDRTGAQPAWNPEQRRAAGKAVEAYYEFTDSLIGELLRNVGPEDLVIVLSDHGFTIRTRSRKMRTGAHDTPDARDGILFARGRGIAAGGDTQGMSILDVTPTILAWLGLPIAEDMDGRMADFVELPTLPRIATYDTSEIQRLLDEASGSDEEIMEQLKLLGYVE